MRQNYRIAKPVGLNSSPASRLPFNTSPVKKQENPMPSLVVPIMFRITKIMKIVFFSRLISSPPHNASRSPSTTRNSSNESKMLSNSIPRSSTSYGIYLLPNHQLLVLHFVDNGRSKMDLYSVADIFISPKMIPSVVILSSCFTILPPLDTPVATRPMILFAVISSGPGWEGLYSTMLMVALFVNQLRTNLIAPPFPFSPLSQPKMPLRSLPRPWISSSLSPRLKVLMPLLFLSTMTSPKWPSSPPVIPISPRKVPLTYIETMPGNVSVFLLNLSRITDPSSLLPSLAPSVIPSVSLRPCPLLIILRRMAKPNV